MNVVSDAIRKLTDERLIFSVKDQDRDIEIDCSILNIDFDEQDEEVCVHYPTGDVWKEKFVKLEEWIAIQIVDKIMASGYKHDSLYCRVFIDGSKYGSTFVDLRKNEVYFLIDARDTVKLGSV